MNNQVPPQPKSFRLTIPVKVVLLTGLAYLLLWVLGIFLQRVLSIDFSTELLRLRVEHWYLLFEIAVLAFVATSSSHFFLDRPLRQLNKVMEQAEQGELSIRAPILSDDELGILSENFNQMLTKISGLSRSHVQSERELAIAQEELKYRSQLAEKSRVIEKANQKLEMLVKDLSLIYEIGQKVNSVIDLEKLYEHITETLKRYLHIEQFSISIYDEEKQYLVVRAVEGFSNKEHVLSSTFRKGEGVAGQAAASGRKIYIRSTTAENRFLHYRGETTKPYSSFLSIPLIYQQEVLGVINFGRCQEAGFSANDVKMLSLVANQVALAVTNAKLYTKTKELSVKDELTGVYNRRHFQRMLKMEWKRAVRFRRDLSVVMIDADHFKEYNDTFGHVQGDQVLKRLGGVFEKNLREVDTVARFGGEEFILLLPDTDKHGAIAVAEKLRKLVEREKCYDADGNETRKITISLGVATFPDDVGGIEDLIDHADIALYRSKEKGRNQVSCFAAPLPKPGEFPLAPLSEEELEKSEEKKKPLRILS